MPLLDGLTKATILVVDDAAVNLRILQHILAENGYKNVYAARDGAEALELAHTHLPELVITDLMMPVMDGFDLCAAVRADTALSSIPIIAQTMLDERTSRLRALKAGANDFMQKPVDPDELALRVQIHLEKHALTLRLRAKDEEMQKLDHAARQAQHALLQDDNTLQTLCQPYGWRITSHFTAGTAGGGSAYGALTLPGGELVLYLCDAKGSGALATMHLLSLRQGLHHALIKGGLQAAKTYITKVEGAHLSAVLLSDDNDPQTLAIGLPEPIIEASHLALATVEETFETLKTLATATPNTPPGQDFMVLMAERQ